MKHTDPIDEGTEMALMFTENAIKAHAVKVAPEQRKVLKEGATQLEWEHLDCVDCGDPIEPERLEWARKRCVCCQSIKEKRDAKRRQ